MENKWAANIVPTEVVWLYVASRGVERDFPGTNLSKDYDPTTLPWYKRGLAFAGMNALDAPYLDESGAGKLVSIVRTVGVGSASGTHASNDQVAAVMGLDFRYSYWKSFVDGILSNCTTNGTVGRTCWLMDSSALLITHSSYTQNGADTVSWLGTKASRLANQFITAGLIHTTTVTDHEHSEVCTLYQVIDSVIPSSGVYLATNAQCGTHWMAKLPNTGSYIVGYSGSTCSAFDTQPPAPSCTAISIDPCTTQPPLRNRAPCPDFVLTAAQIEALRVNKCSSTSSAASSVASTTRTATRTSSISTSDGFRLSPFSLVMIISGLVICLVSLQIIV